MKQQTKKNKKENLVAIGIVVWVGSIVLNEFVKAVSPNANARRIF